MIHTVKGFGIVNKAEVDVFLELSCFLMIQWVLAIWSLVPLPFLNPAWTSGIHVLLKPGLQNFEHYFASMWDEYICAVVWTFFGIAFLWNWNESWPFPFLWPLMSVSGHNSWKNTGDKQILWGFYSFLNLIFILYYSIVAIQDWVNFWCTASWFSYTYTYIPFLKKILFL